MKRIWNLRLNLDEFNAVYGAAFSDYDRSQLLIGLFIGCNNGSMPEDTSKILRTAFEVGYGWRQEAEGYRSAKSEGGKKSAASRKEKYGSNQPPQKDKNFEDTSKILRGFPEQTSNQSPIPNPLTNTPLPPKGEKKVPGKNVGPVPPELSESLGKLISLWPRFFLKDGSKIPLPGLTKAQDLYERMRHFFPKDDVAEMIQCGFKHLQGDDGPQNEWDFTPKQKTGYTIAMNNFYGQQARWKEFR